MPVYKMLLEMPHDEFMGWQNYFERRPVGWREDDRTFKLMQIQGCKDPAGKIFASLTPIYQRSTGGNPIIGLKQSALFQKIMEAKGGDQPDFLKDL